MSTITFKRGDTLRLAFKFTNADTSVHDLTGVTFRLEVRNQARAVKAAVASGSGIEVDLVTGIATVIVADSVTASFELQPHFTDIELTYPNGDVVSSETITINVVEDFTI